ncbi:hypothetical protein QWZ13_10445 [Reinekea marina]|uniref:DUF3304 domain-containing protein n=1 Tax=Reinekea marina TaxID=1310421 RepID=A0ABV7WT10_9GAMM|nr:hypothetical protein [Reinekea marina]MDN3649333.1 hypothetical protein [Reinekea marina]
MSKSLFLILLAWCLVAGCSANPKFEKYTFNFSAEEDDRFFITDAIFDRTFGAPAGGVGCCLATGGASSSLRVSYYPSYGEFTWYDLKHKQFYKAKVEYPDNVQEMAANLPREVWLFSDDEPVEGGPELITSVTSDNWVITWLANYPGGPNIKKRELIELGRAKGVPFEREP